VSGPFCSAGLLAAAALALCAAPSSAAPIDVVRDCAANVSAQASGIKDLDSACPGLEDALVALGLDQLLYEGWRQQLNRDALGNVVQLADGYRGSAPAGPDVAALAGILETLSGEQAPAPQSWWDVFKAWLGNWLSSHGEGSLSWLDRWLATLRQSVNVLNVILYALIALVLAAAGWIVVNELKAAGVSGRRGRRPAGAAPDSAVAAVAADAAEPMAVADRLSHLLRLLVRRLMQTGRLNAERSLTHRELVSRARLDSEPQRAVFAAVASAAECAVYGARVPAPEHLSAVLREGDALLAELPDT